MKPFLILFLLLTFVSCKDNNPYMRDTKEVNVTRRNIKSATSIITNSIPDSFQIITQKTNIKNLTKWNSNVILKYSVTNVIPVTNKIKQLNYVILESPKQANLNERFLVYVKLSQDVGNNKFNIQVKKSNATHIAKDETLYLNLESLYGNDSDIYLRYITKSKDGKMRITYMVEFFETGTRYLNVVIYKSGFSEPIIEQQVKVLVTFKTWLERFWGRLLGIIGGLSGAIGGILLLIQNSKKIKKEVVHNEGGKGNLDENEEKILQLELEQVKVEKQLLETEKKLLEMEKERKEL